MNGIFRVSNYLISRYLILWYVKDIHFPNKLNAYWKGYNLSFCFNSFGHQFKLQYDQSTNIESRSLSLTKKSELVILKFTVHFNLYSDYSHIEKNVFLLVSFYFVHTFKLNLINIHKLVIVFLFFLSPSFRSFSLLWSFYFCYIKKINTRNVTLNIYPLLNSLVLCSRGSNQVTSSFLLFLSHSLSRESS